MQEPCLHSAAVVQLLDISMEGGICYQRRAIFDRTVVRAALYVRAAAVWIHVGRLWTLHLGEVCIDTHLQKK